MFTASSSTGCTYLGDKSLGDHGYTVHYEQVNSFKAHIWTKDEAVKAEIAKRFPKWVNVKVGSQGVFFQVSFYEVKGNSKNETGIKRVRKFLELAGEIEWHKASINCHQSLEQFLEHFNNL